MKTRVERYPYEVRVAPGCHGGPDRFGAIVSRHATWTRARRAADRSDRLVAIAPDGTTYQIPQQNHPTLGAGRFGQRRKERP